MDIDELQTVQSRERQTDSLQQLRDSFYAEVSEFVQQLRDARDDAAQRVDDPWDHPEINRLNDQIKTAEQTVEAIYDRRVGKIVKKASLAAAEMPTGEDGLTSEERALFERLVESIQDNRDHVLDMVAGDVEPDTSSVSDPSPESGETTTAPVATESEAETPPEPEEQHGEPPTPTDSSPTPTDDGERVSAADVMDQGETKQADGGTAPTASDPSPSTAVTESEPSGEPSTESSPGVDRRTVKITEDVGAILGVDEREYDLSTDDVVTLPADNADPLVQRDAAQPLD
jgi:DNA replication factor GINS